MSADRDQVFIRSCCSGSSGLKSVDQDSVLKKQPAYPVFVLVRYLLFEIQCYIASCGSGYSGITSPAD